MSGATTARDAILKALKKSYAPVHHAGREYALAYKQAIDKTDLVEAMAEAIILVLSAEHLQEMAGEAVKTARAELARVMDEVGCHHISSGPFTAYLSKRPPFVSIDDPSKIPPQYMRTPEPVPDKKAIKDAIETGTDVPGASLAIPNAQTLAIRSKSK